MYLKRLFPLVFIFTTYSIKADEPNLKLKIYGFIRNDFYYNSRKNEESTDGTFSYFPKPIELNAGVDKNDVATAEMISVNSRIGLDVSGTNVLNAKSTAKLEADFAGFSTSYYVLRIRQAYAKLNWETTELLIGQTWHPLFGNVSPTVLSLNTGSPFQPFNRSPQVRFNVNINKQFSLTGAAIYEMQFLSNGPIGASASYMKNAIIPNLFLGSEYKTSHWISGLGIDFKTIKPDIYQISSASAVLYTQYSDSKFQLKGKAILGENLSDQAMIGGYGVSKFSTDSTTAKEYTNFNTFTSWINIVYGSKIQVGIFAGISQNLGTNKTLDLRKGNKLTAYGCGYYDNTQILIDQLFRVSPHINYSLPNFKIGIEYELSSAKYGVIQQNGRVKNPYSINNNRIVAVMSYIF